MDREEQRPEKTVLVSEQKGACLETGTVHAHSILWKQLKLSTLEPDSRFQVLQFTSNSATHKKLLLS